MKMTYKISFSFTIVLKHSIDHSISNLFNQELMKASSYSINNKTNKKELAIKFYQPKRVKTTTKHLEAKHVQCAHADKTTVDVDGIFAKQCRGYNFVSDDTGLGADTQYITCWECSSV